MAVKKKTRSKAKPKSRTSTKRAKPKTRRKTTTSRKKAKPRTTAKTKTTKKRSSTGGTMARRKKTKKSTTRRKTSRPKAKLKDVITNVVTMLGGGVAASVAANKMPVGNNKTRALIPLGIGAIAVMLGAKKKKAAAVSLGTGMMLVGGLSAIRANFPSVPLLAGEDSDVLELMGEMDLVRGEGGDYYVPQLEYAGEDEDDLMGFDDDLDGDMYEIAGYEDDLSGEDEYYVAGEDDEDLDGDMYEIAGAEYPTPATM